MSDGELVVEWVAADGAAWRQAVAAGPGGQEAPSPGMMEYATDVAAALVGWLEVLLGRALPAGFPLDLVVLVFAYGIVALSLSLAVVLTLRAVRGRARRSARTAIAMSEPATEAPESLTPEEWYGRVAARLRAGDVRGALEAIWWWLAGRLAPTGLEGSWTSAQLLTATGRRELAGELARLDRWRYGGEPPATGTVEKLVSDLEGRLS